jgi:hypothetical protein
VISANEMPNANATPATMRQAPNVSTMVVKMSRIKFSLQNAQQGHQAFQAAWHHAKGWLCAGGGNLVLEIRPETRSDAQNRLLHACLGEIAKSLEWAGKKRDVETWKRLLTAAWLRSRGEGVEVLPAIDGHGIDVVFRHTSKLTKSECAELSEFVMAWAAQNGVQV